MIADTSFLIDVMNRLPAAVKLLQEHKEPINITTISIFELWSGVSRSAKQEHEKIKIRDVLAGQIVHVLDESAAEKGGFIQGLLLKAGETIDPEDCMIAGIAINLREPILTRNVEHFKRIKGLLVETY